MNGETMMTCKLDDRLANDIVQALWKEKDKDATLRQLSLTEYETAFFKGRLNALTWAIQLISTWNDRSKKWENSEF